MKTWVRKTLSVGVLAAGALLVAPTAAQAEIGMVSWDNDGIANGTQVALPIQVPVNVCGTGVGAALGLGAGQALCSNGAAHDVNVDGDQEPQYWAAADQKKAKKAKHESARTEGAWMLSGDNDGILNGTQVYAPIQVPVNICGTGIGILGFGFGQAVCTNGAAWDVNAEDEDNDSNYYARSAKKEFLPVAGGLTSGLPVVGGSGLPALGGNFAQGSQMNLAGIDPTSFLAGLPTG